MLTTLELSGITLDVVRKDIKNVHLSVHPPTGRVRISAPMRMSRDTIRVFAISKLGWIRRQQDVLRAQERETQREYLDRESHHAWGRRYLLRIVEAGGASGVELRHSQMILRVPEGADTHAREAVLAAWYRRQIRAAVPALIEAWAPRLCVVAERFHVQHMKTRWGSCNPVARSIRLNAELAKKPRECLEYIVVHELAHLRDATHGPRFISLLDGVMPDWRRARELLNRLPARHEHWRY